MLVQVCDAIINTDQINYVKEFEDLGDGKVKTVVGFINKDSLIFPVTLNDFIKTVNLRALACRVRDVELKDVEPRQDVTKK